MKHKERTATTLNRRAFLGGAGAILGLPGSGAAAQEANPARADGQAPAGLIFRSRGPDNLESPFQALDGFLTPNNLFYVRSHFEVPKVADIGAWRLKVEGAVERPLELSREDLLRLPARTRATLLECAGNGRVLLTPKVSGLLWDLGAVGNAEWTGVPLAAILERAGLKSSAVEVILEGADSGEFRDEPKSPGKIHFARSLPLEKAKKPDVLLAYKMNGADLSPAHGYPLRAVVSGWYGMASVKWLQRIVVVDRPFQGFFQTFDYTYFARRDGLPTLMPVGELQVKAQIARPARREVIPAGAGYRVFGAAWTAESEVARVEFSTDRGKTWAEAELMSKPIQHAWQLWQYQWRTPGRAGEYTLMARATDKRGRVQPMERDPDWRNVMISHVLPIEVEVR